MSPACCVRLPMRGGPRWSNARSSRRRTAAVGTPSSRSGSTRHAAPFSRLTTRSRARAGSTRASRTLHRFCGCSSCRQPVRMCGGSCPAGPNGQWCPCGCWRGYPPERAPPRQSGMGNSIMDDHDDNMPPPRPTAVADPGAVIPRATYRVQLNAGFTFRDVTAIVPYLAALGVSHVYCSPYFRARAGSTHGYDVVDHNSFNPEIGDREDFERFVAVLRTHRMGHIVDIVPNHVGILGAENDWWMDVLENGEASRYAQLFDIEWAPSNP